MAARPHCPDCDRVLEEGFLLDHTHGGQGVLNWVAGLAEKSVWTGLKMRGRTRVPVLAMRCPRCGLIRMYAREG